MNIESLAFRAPSKEWVENRSTYIGSTDIAAIMGLHPYRSEMSVYLDKTDMAAPVKLNQPMVHGQNLELYVAQLYRAATGRKIHKSKFRFIKDKPHLAANPDYEVVGERPLRLLECKTAGSWAGKVFGEETDAIPNQYLVQCMWQLAVTGRQICDLAVLIGGQEFRIYTVEREEELIREMIDRADQWWNDYIVYENPPPISGHDADSQIIRDRWPTSDTEEMFADPDLDELCRQLSEVSHARKSVDTEVSRLSNLIKDRMGSAGTLNCSIGTITWKTDVRGSRRFCTSFKEKEIGRK